MSYITPARLGQFKALQDQFNETKFGKVKTINDISPDENGNVLIGLATATSDGLLSKEDKEKIDTLSIKTDFDNETETITFYMTLGGNYGDYDANEETLTI